MQHMQKSLVLVTQASDLPVTLSQVKAHCNILASSTDDDSRLTDYIWAATEYIETQTGRSYSSEQWDWFMPTWPARQIAIPKPPLASIDFVKYYDVNDVQQTIDPSQYQVIAPTVVDPGLLCPVPGTVWPITYCDTALSQALLGQWGLGYGYYGYGYWTESWWNHRYQWMRPDAVNIRFTTADSVISPTLKHTILVLVSLFNENREMMVPADKLAGVDRLINSLKDGSYR